MAAVNSNNTVEQSYYPEDGNSNGCLNWEKFVQAQESIEQHEWETQCIYRVPTMLKVRPEDDNYFKAISRPRLVSIGPYHYGDPRLESMQFHKYRVLHCILKKTQKQINDILKFVKNLEDQARACYQDLPATSFSSDTFVEILLLDACFILHILFDLWDEQVKDPVIYKRSILPRILEDMILLENQIPLFIVDRLFRFLFIYRRGNEIPDKILKIFNSGMLIGRDLALTYNEGERQHADINHRQNVLSLFWKNLMFDSTTKDYTTKKEQQWTIDEKGSITDLEQYVIPSVTALMEAGVIFKHKTTTPFWNIEFNSTGVLEIPQILINDFSEPMLFNLVAFELCHLDEEQYKVIPYVLFMDYLVNTAADVSELRARGIIINTCGNDEQVAELFHRLGNRVMVTFNHFEGLCREINKYCNKRRNRWRATLMHDYFNNPWSIISFFAAAFLIVSSFLQTCYSAAQYYHKS